MLKVDEVYIKFNTEQRKYKKLIKTKKTSLSNKSVKNAEFYKPVLNKVMTSHE